jgi:hypothetical protein
VFLLDLVTCRVESHFAGNHIAASRRPSVNEMGQSVARAQTTGTGDKSSSPIATGGEVFPDGNLLEIVRDRSRAARPALLHWDRKHATVAPEIVIRGRHYIPLEIDASLWRHLRLPSGFVACGSTTQLFDRIRSLITKYSGLSDGYATLLTHFVLSSFFVDCLQTAPCVVLHGCADAEAVALLRLLGWFCRHPVLLTDAGLSVPDCLRPTRLISQPHANTKKLLAPLQLSGFVTSRNGSLQEISSATAIYLGDWELRSPFIDSCLRIPITPARVLVSSSDEQREAAVIEDVQNQMLSYRVVHFGKVQASDFDAPKFSGSIRGLARSLGACIVDAPDLQASLVMQLQGHDEALRLDRISHIHSVLVEALLVCCHERRPAVYVKQIADVANIILSRQGELFELSAREAGGKLKTLGFRTTRLDSAGRGLYVLGENCRRIHELGTLYRVPSLKERLPGCPHCREL